MFMISNYEKVQNNKEVVINEQLVKHSTVDYTLTISKEFCAINLPEKIRNDICAKQWGLNQIFEIIEMLKIPLNNIQNHKESLYVKMICA